MAEKKQVIEKRVWKGYHLRRTEAEADDCPGSGAKTEDPDLR
jgi:hypothetical protein